MPTAKTPAAPVEGPIAAKLKGVIRARRLPALRVAEAAGVEPTAVSRFLKGERGLTLATADKIAAALGLELKEGHGGVGRKGAAKRGGEGVAE